LPTQNPITQQKHLPPNNRAPNHHHHHPTTTTDNRQQLNTRRDVFPSQRAVEFARQRLRRHNDPARCAAELVQEALRMHSSDNLTVVVVCLGDEPPPARWVGWWVGWFSVWMCGFVGTDVDEHCSAPRGCVNVDLITHTPHHNTQTHMCRVYGSSALQSATASRRNSVDGSRRDTSDAGSAPSTTGPSPVIKPSSNHRPPSPLLLGAVAAAVAAAPVQAQREGAGAAGAPSPGQQQLRGQWQAGPPRVWEGHLRRRSQ